MYIKPPFANYHRAELERLVQEGFDLIERHAAKMKTRSMDWVLTEPFLTPHYFQVLMAAEYYLRTTKEKKQ